MYTIRLQPMSNKNMKKTGVKKSRREIMQAVRSKNTKPEMLVRKLVHKMGYRYRLHKKGLAGSPDMVFPKQQKIIFVHGCFWHGHDCLSGKNKPSSNREYWGPKLKRNMERDKENQAILKAEGWKVFIVWECETKDQDVLSKRIRSFLK